MPVEIEVPRNLSWSFVRHWAFAPMVKPTLAVKKLFEPSANYFVSDFGIAKFSQGSVACLRTPEGSGRSVDGASRHPSMAEGVGVGEVWITL